MNDIILQAVHIDKSFREQPGIPILSDINVDIQKGEYVSLMGRSGCGKSTLLYILSTMDTDYKGELYIDNELMTGQKSNHLAEVRNEKIGFVFQFHYLLNEFTVLKNVMLPALKMARLPLLDIETKAMEWLNMLGIHQLAPKYPNQLSGGEKQRVAIARALINSPCIILADEPTGNLDKKNSDLIFDIFQQLSDNFGQTLLIVTHDPGFANRTKRIIQMEDGRIV
ncbi:ABC transporter ATP-binding protein [Flavisolibacter ginsengisoli]|jgi:lipoprotein-releasing system ATP-binding protein|uniref:Lipoprotein-releasing system ATP-binding protein n=1 Tax=Flavisolibacter ginsengisoli DSM 18119 TaxID=1121884 RepID=A0A1M4TZW3_9BACT|nr:ABC transporter ATP-binding protein [Flavisolibacter ginsengisoli]SHE50052.1 lipoprotein-releasing system ATP-binding protein [Flavisolibacter ginsengisoli DSM 18119]